MPPLHTLQVGMKPAWQVASNEMGNQCACEMLVIIQTAGEQPFERILAAHRLEVILAAGAGRSSKCLALYPAASCRPICCSHFRNKARGAAAAGRTSMYSVLRDALARR